MVVLIATLVMSNVDLRMAQRGQTSILRPVGTRI
nr:MAG TPA: hypothetical protein [Caudoviricetes sp.]